MRKKLYYFITIFSVFFITSLHAQDLKAIEQNISDSVITTKITAQFAESKHLNPLKISVTTSQGIVSLHGFVGDKQAYIDALRIVKNTAGVKAVNDQNLAIKKVNTAFTDAFITAKVETAVLKAKVLEDESIPLVGINAHTVNGVVTLSGTVKNPKSVAAIIKYTNSIPGVKKIITNLEVQEKG
ncbi:MAG: BON domain-containing protein [bacterium]|nr:BON domain-containing protein [bacterium]